MGVNFEFKTEGFDEVIKALRRAEDKELREEVFNAGKPIIAEIREEAKDNCPVDTGNLRDAIKSSNSKKKLAFRVYVSDKKAYYAPFVEYGHKMKDGKDVPAQAFVTPAGRAHEKEFEKAVEKALINVAKRAIS